MKRENNFAKVMSILGLMAVIASAILPGFASALQGEVMHLDFNTAGSIAQDISGDNDGKVYEATWMKNGTYRFDGKDDRISAGSSSGISLASSPGYTVSFWLNAYDT